MAISEVGVGISRPVPYLSDEELAELNQEFELLPAGKIVQWARDTFGAKLCLAASMQDAVLIDVATKVDPSIEIFFVDTGYHFPDTLVTLDRVQARYGVEVNVVRNPAPLDDLWMEDPDACCAARKVQPLEDVLAGRAAWMSGLRRAESQTRSAAPIVGRDKRGLVKINPLANWDDLDIEGYVADHEIVVNPLLSQGYASIGCWPCTKPVAEGDHPRAGRWAGTDKTECGLHD